MTSASTPLRFPPLVVAGQCQETFAALPAAMSWRRVAVISGTTFEDAVELTAKLRAATRGRSDVQRWDRGAPHCQVERVEAIAGEMEEYEPDVIVSGGGGSSHDAAKGVATLLALKGGLLDHCLTYDPPNQPTAQSISGPKTPLVTLPSTLSGSEANGAAGFSPAGYLGKRVISDASLVPHAVLIDPSIIATVDRSIFLGSVLNAIDHCIEGIASRRDNPLSKMMLRAALQVLGNAPLLPQGVIDSSTLIELAGASVMAGSALAGTWLGIAHAIGHVLGATYGIPHGLCHAVVAGPCVRYNSAAVGSQHASTAAALGLAPHSDGLADWIEDLARRWELPITLDALGVPASDLDGVAGRVLRDHDTYFNPRQPASVSEVGALLASMH